MDGHVPHDEAGRMARTLVAVLGVAMLALLAAVAGAGTLVYVVWHGTRRLLR